MDLDVFYVTENSKYYPGHELRVPAWFTINEKFHNRKNAFVDVVEYRPDRSIKISFVAGKMLILWVPLSICDITITKNRSLEEFF